MKQYHYLIRVIGLVLLTSVIGCKDYGVKVQDGYDDHSGIQETSKLDSNMLLIDKSKYDRAKIFPGLVHKDEPRVMDTTFTLDLNFTRQDASALRISSPPQPMFSTGFYAAPGELIKIVVPEGIHGLYVQIGGHTDNLTGKDPLQRDPIIISRHNIFPGVNYMRNLYGGTIYIWSKVSYPNPVSFKISGAVVSPDFVLGKMTDEEWIAKVQKSHVPWLEMRSNRVIFLVPRDKVIQKINGKLGDKLDKPTELMTLWNTRFERDYNGWMGLSDDAEDPIDLSPQAAWRGVLDIQISLGYGHSGFPFMGFWDNNWFNSFTSLEQMKYGGSKPGIGNNWGTYHEFGHNCQQGGVWSWKALGEVTCNIFSFKVAHENKIPAKSLRGEGWIAKGLEFADKPGAKDFNQEAKNGGIGVFERLGPFIQLCEVYGYGLITHVYRQARRAERLPIDDFGKSDFYYEAASEYANVDLAPYFKAWGIRISPQAKQRVGSRALPRLSKKIWQYDLRWDLGGEEDKAYKDAKIASLPDLPVATITASSEETSSFTPAPNGTAAAMFDGLSNTFWHPNTKEPAGQYTITIDLGEETYFNAIYLAPWHFSGKRVKEINVQTKGNSGSYSNVTTIDDKNNGNFTLENSDTAIPKAEFKVSDNFKARYIKVTIKSSYSDDGYVAISDIGILP